MKKKVFTGLLSCLIVSQLFFSATGMAQAPPPPPDSGDKGGVTNKAPGGGASLEAGVSMFLLLIAGYGALNARKIFRAGS